MATRRRLDAELVRRGLARSRTQAAGLIADGRVQVHGQAATKPATLVDPASAIIVSSPPTHRADSPGVAATPGISADAPGEYVSRGALKLAGALDVMGASSAQPPLQVAGRRCLDAGASTGGFTEVLLRRGARQVVAVDVGYGQLAWSLRQHERVVVLERTNVRYLTPDQIGGQVDLTVADLSFISLRLVLPALSACTGPGGDLVVMVKPQFELGPARVGRGGVVRAATDRADAVAGVAEAALTVGRHVVDLAVSPLPGPRGNVEVFLRLRSDGPLDLAGSALPPGATESTAHVAAVRAWALAALTRPEASG
jgi:23S rRNA (cytidine1920-2'-O)/16S rRNA (cytidine1409-2'-O)-methyltransferase